MAFEINLIAAGFLVLNYIAFAGLFLYRHFRPKEWAVWLVEGSVGLFVVYALTLFVLLASFFIMAILQEASMEGAFLFPFVFGFLILILSAIKQVMNLGGGSILPFALYLLSIGQELYHAIASPGGFVLVFLLMIWYFIGVFVIMLGGNLIGRILDRLFPRIESEHLAIMKKRFGPEAPRVIMFNDGSSASGFGGAGTFAGMGVMYSLWMVAHILLLSYFF